MLVGLFVELFVRDAGPYRELLVSGLGLTEDRRSDTVTAFEAGNGRILLHEGVSDLAPDHRFASALERREPCGDGVEIAIEVDDVHAAYAAASALPLFRVTPLIRQSWGLLDFRVTCPDGYYLRFTEQRRQR